MKTLVVGQNSKLSKLIGESQSQANGFAVWEDTGKIVKYPISIEESANRNKIWIGSPIIWTKTFEEICSLFPDFVWDLPMGTKASWGTGNYVESADGYPVLMDSDWDTSD